MIKLSKLFNLFDIIKKHQLLSIMAKYAYNIFRYNKKHAITQLSELSLNEYELISQSSAKYLRENILDNNYYGTGSSIRKYIDRNRSINAFIEHGYIFGDFVDLNCNKWYTENIITFGNVRKTHLQSKTDKNIITIGPYIHYAEEYLKNSDYLTLKQQLGKMLLIIPVHGPTGGSFIYDRDIILNNISQIRSEYDTIGICLFYSDVRNKELLHYYVQKGFKIFCAGYKYDWNFLSRLKTIIKLSDYTVSNYPGTHTGYCVHLNKPHWIVKQNIERNPITKKGFVNFYGIRSQSEEELLEIEIQEVADVFYNYSDKITVSQNKIIDKYWGISHIKDKNQLKLLFEKYGI